MLLLSEDDTACASHSASAVWTHVKLIKCLLSGFFWADSNITAARTCVAHLAPSDGAIIDATRLIYALSKGCQPLTRVRNARRSTIKITKWQQEQARAASDFIAYPAGQRTVCDSLSLQLPFAVRWVLSNLTELANIDVVNKLLSLALSPCRTDELVSGFSVRFLTAITNQHKICSRQALWCWAKPK